MPAHGQRAMFGHGQLQCRLYADVLHVMHAGGDSGRPAVLCAGLCRVQPGPLGQGRPGVWVQQRLPADRSGCDGQPEQPGGCGIQRCGCGEDGILCPGCGEAACTNLPLCCGALSLLQSGMLAGLLKGSIMPLPACN